MNWKELLKKIARWFGQFLDQQLGGSPSAPAPEPAPEPDPEPKPSELDLVVIDGTSRKSVTVTPPFTWTAFITGVDRFEPNGTTNNPDAAHFVWLVDRWQGGNSAPGVYVRTYKMIVADATGRHEPNFYLYTNYTPSNNYKLMLTVTDTQAHIQVYTADGGPLSDCVMKFKWPKRGGTFVPLTLGWGYPPSVRPGLIGMSYREVTVK